MATLENVHIHKSMWYASVSYEYLGQV